jgi:hypothetical protein
MRIIPVFLSLLATGIPAASAQQAAPPPAPAAAADATKATAAPSAPSPPHNFIINGDSVIRAVPPRTAEEQKADAEARAVWEARCRPVIVEDAEGLRRTQYAAPDCDLSTFNTAGFR